MKSQIRLACNLDVISPSDSGKANLKNLNDIYNWVKKELIKKTDSNSDGED